METLFDILTSPLLWGIVTMGLTAILTWRNVENSKERAAKIVEVAKIAVMATEQIYRKLSSTPGEKKDTAMSKGLSLLPSALRASDDVKQELSERIEAEVGTLNTIKDAAKGKP